jgi:hypothetical protein
MTYGVLHPRLHVGEEHHAGVYKLNIHVKPCDV